MGWLFLYECPRRADLVAELRRPDRFDGWRATLSSVVGNHHWYLCVPWYGDAVVGLDLMASSRDGWGYKAMDESFGPNAVDCPLGILNEAGPPPNDYATQWRDRVREYHRRRAAMPRPRPGLVVAYGGHDYRLDAPAGPRRGWNVTRVSDGLWFRMKAKQVTEALMNATLPASR